MSSQDQAFPVFNNLSLHGNFARFLLVLIPFPGFRFASILKFHAIKSDRVFGVWSKNANSGDYYLSWPRHAISFILKTTRYSPNSYSNSCPSLQLSCRSRIFWKNQFTALLDKNLYLELSLQNIWVIRQSSHLIFPKRFRELKSPTEGSRTDQAKSWANMNSWAKTSPMPSTRPTTVFFFLMISVELSLFLIFFQKRFTRGA